MTQYAVEKTQIKSVYGIFDFYCFSWGPHEEDNVLCLVNPAYEGFPTVRIQSACYTAEIFRSLDCDCHEQLHASQKLIAAKGGFVIYMLCDGRGAGLLHKIRGLEMGRMHGTDTSDAYRQMGLEQDPRDYARVVEILRYFQLKEVNLLTNNPRKIQGLTQGGIRVNRAPLEIGATENSAPYLKTKAHKMGHLFAQFSEDAP